MSIIRVGLAETKKFAEGYEAIFGKKKGATETETTAAEDKPAKTKDAAKKAGSKGKKK